MRRFTYQVPTNVALACMMSRCLASSSASSSSSSSSFGEAGKKEQPVAPAATAAEATSKTQETASAANQEEKEYHFPTKEVLNSLKKGDLKVVQTHANELVQRTWRDEYSVPAACFVIFIVMWYWIAWSRRSIRRKCAALEAAVAEEANQTRETVKNLTERWNRDMRRTNEHMKGIIDKNSTLTADIDRMTTALRSCSVRPGSSLSKPAAAPATAPAETPNSGSDSQE